MVNIKITVPTINYWTESTKSAARQKMLDVINGFRSAVNVSPVTLNTTAEYQTYMDQRAASEAKQLADTGSTDHSGQNMYQKFGVNSAEDIGAIDVNAGNSLDA